MFATKLVVFALLLSFICNPSQAAPQRPWAHRFQIVQMLNPDRTSSATGFMIRTAGGLAIIVTNNHVCDDNLEMSAGNQFTATLVEGRKVLRKDPLNDLCIVEAPKGSMELELGAAPKRGQHVTVIGHPRGGPMRANEGKVIGGYAGEWLTTAHVEPGNSGSPVLDDDGLVVGIVSAYDRRTNVGYFVSVDMIRELTRDL